MALGNDDGLLGEIIALFILILFELAVFPALNPLLAEAVAPFGVLGGLMLVVIWGGPPASLMAAIALFDRHSHGHGI